MCWEGGVYHDEISQNILFLTKPAPQKKLAYQSLTNQLELYQKLNTFREEKDTQLQSSLVFSFSPKSYKTKQGAKHGGTHL
jgi:hypothetical protein